MWTRGDECMREDERKINSVTVCLCKGVYAFVWASVPGRSEVFSSLYVK